jgi:hypothetical protein
MSARHPIIRAGRPRVSMHLQSSHRFRPCAEFLEGRTLLAGNVTTTPTGTPDSPGEPAPALLIQGDGADNEIMVKKGAAANEIIVNGLNGTLVNGSTQELHFSGVQALAVLMDGGNDQVDLRNLTLSGVPDPTFGFSMVQVAVDGGAGDDRITMFNTTIDASAPPPDPDVLFFPTSSVAVLLFGETSGGGDTSGTGNDFIEVSNTTIIAEGGELSASTLIIYGEQNAGGTITGGNDHINVSNTVIRATNTSFAGSGQAAVAIYGDDNSADGTSVPTSIIGQGNDWIDVNGTSIIADSAQGSSTALVQIYGDQNTASGAGTATIGNLGAKTGGDDTINLTNTTVSASGAVFTDETFVVDLRGEQNLSQLATATATVGNGNDTITVNNFDVNSPGTNVGNSADLAVFGDGDYISTGVTNFGRIGRGNDVIYVQNCEVTGTPSDVASALLYSDDRTQAGEAGTTVGDGTDNVQLSSFLLQSTASANVQLHTQKGNDVVDVLSIEVGFLGMSTGSGNDDVSVLNSQMMTGNWDFEDGNDLLKINGCTFVLIDANGGLGIDTLQAHGNIGVLVPLSFEVVNMS